MLTHSQSHCVTLSLFIHSFVRSFVRCRSFVGSLSLCSLVVVVFVRSLSFVVVVFVVIVFGVVRCRCVRWFVVVRCRSLSSVPSLSFFPSVVRSFDPSILRFSFLRELTVSLMRCHDAERHDVDHRRSSRRDGVLYCVVL